LLKKNLIKKMVNKKNLLYLYWAIIISSLVFIKIFKHTILVSIDNSFNIIVKEKKY
jgi:hypothetical protein